jgi:adenylyltransferase/sulfurtransferase
VLYSFDLKTPGLDEVPVARRPTCQACGTKELRHLAGRADEIVELCGRDVLQVRARAGTNVDLAALEARLSKSLEARRIDSALRFRAEGHDVVVFADGRALVHGTEDPARAKAIYARYIG